MECDTKKRNVILTFECEGRKYRVIAEIISNKGDIETYLEQYVHDVLDKPGIPKKEVWLKVSKELSDKNNMTIEQCTMMLALISGFINDNFFLI